MYSPHQNPISYTSNTQSNKDKINYLHKMLDNQIDTVNTLFEKDNAFEQIEAKLKQLQVKLNSIKDQETVNYKSNTKEQSNYFSKNSLSNSKGKSSIAFQGSFQSLSKYKKNKKEKEKMEASNTEIRKSQNHQSSHGVKLNFELNQIHEEGIAYQTGKGKNLGINSNLISNRKSLNKIKSQGTAVFYQNKKRSKSSHSKLQLVQQNISYPSRNLTRQNSSKKHNTSKGRISLATSDKKCVDVKKQRSATSKKKLQKSKTSINLNNFKNKATLFSNEKVKPSQQYEAKERISQIIRKSEAKKFQKQLINYKNKTENLQMKVNELKGYKVEYQKLKDIFQKEDKIKKYRKRL